MAKNTENIAKKMITQVRQIQKEKEVLEKDFQEIQRNIYNLLNQGKLTPDIQANLQQFLSTYDNTNDLIFELQNQQQSNTPRNPTRLYNFNYNQAIRNELEPYMQLVGWGVFSKCLRSDRPDLVYRTFQPGEVYEILIQLLEIYGKYLLSDEQISNAYDPQKAYENNAYIIDKLTTAFESWITYLEREELIKS